MCTRRSASGGDGDADARRQVDLAAGHAEGPGHDLVELFGDARGLEVATDVLAHHGELVAADPPDDIARPHGPPQPPGQGQQEAVAEVMPEAVVDLLEAVDVQHENGNR